jgi:ribosomal protein S18 acetylase RimI-like enzyme
MSIYRVTLFILYISLCTIVCSELDITIRPATLADMAQIRSALWHEGMNPLTVKPETVLVACSPSNKIVGFGQVRPHTPSFSVLASVYVYPDSRRQGVGSAVVEALCQRHDETTDTQLVLLTMQSTMPFYNKFGFYETNSSGLPLLIQAEVMLDNIVSSLLGKVPLVPMVRDKKCLP